MGWDPMFKVTHNLDVSSPEALRKDLEAKLKVRIYLCLGVDSFDIENDENFDISIYDGEFTDCTEKIVLDVYNNHRYTLYYPDSYSDTQYSNEIFHITKNTLSGFPDFNGRWYLLYRLFKENQSIEDPLWKDFLRHRKALYEYLKPVIKELPVYYHADCEMDDLGDPDSMEEVEALRKKKKLELLNLSEFIKDPDFSNAPDPYCTVYADDFSDLISKSLTDVELLAGEWIIN